MMKGLFALPASKIYPAEAECSYSEWQAQKTLAADHIAVWIKRRKFLIEKVLSPLGI
jgi:hypothetical protein